MTRRTCHKAAVELYIGPELRAQARESASKGAGSTGKDAERRELQLRAPRFLDVSRLDLRQLKWLKRRISLLKQVTGSKETVKDEL